MLVSGGGGSPSGESPQTPGGEELGGIFLSARLGRDGPGWTLVPRGVLPSPSLGGWGRSGGRGVWGPWPPGPSLLPWRPALGLSPMHRPRGHRATEFSAHKPGALGGGLAPGLTGEGGARTPRPGLPQLPLPKTDWRPWVREQPGNAQCGLQVSSAVSPRPGEGAVGRAGGLPSPSQLISRGGRDPLGEPAGHFQEASHVRICTQGQGCRTPGTRRDKHRFPASCA